jgi:hypothetical protein
LTGVGAVSEGIENSGATLPIVTNGPEVVLDLALGCKITIKRTTNTMAIIEPIRRLRSFF